MVEKAARAAHREICVDSWSECQEYGGSCITATQTVLNAILPQVSTVAELEALPVGVKVLSPATGDVWVKGQSDWTGTGGGFSGHRSNEQVMLRHQGGTLTVVWTPDEVTA
jgi:hypothetical protein